MSGSGCPAAALAENFDFSDERVRADPPAVYAELRKGPPRWSNAYGGFWVVISVEFPSVQGVHSVQSLPVTFTPSSAEAFAANPLVPDGPMPSWYFPKPLLGPGAHLAAQRRT